MSGYELSLNAIRDLHEILVYAEEHSGTDAAIDLQERILSGCEKLSITPGLGHRRPDLTSQPYFFYTLDPYLIVYARQTHPLPILRILHSSRHVRRLLRTKFRG